MKIKRCFSTLTCIDATIAEVVTYAKNHNMSGVEIRLDAAQTVCGTGLEGADDIRALFADAGIAITDLATGVNVTGLGDLGAEMTKAEGCVKLASAVGAGAIRIFVGGHQPKLSVAPRKISTRLSLLSGTCATMQKNTVSPFGQKPIPRTPPLHR